MYQTVLGRGRAPNYIHQLRDESAALLSSGGLWKYCNDSHEGLQYEAKKIWMNFSARGAEGRESPIDIVCQRHFMTTHLCTMEDGPHCLHMLKAEQKKQKEMLMLANADVPEAWGEWEC